MASAATPAADPQWCGRLDALAAADGPPAPITDDYTWLVWAFAQERAGQLSPEQAARLTVLPDQLRALPDDPWVRRYLECAARSFDARPLSGGPRARWLSAQRGLHARGELPAGRAALLERLEGFTWNSPDDERWWAVCAAVTSFAAEHGRIPTHGDDPALARWLSGQRRRLRMGRLDPERSGALSGLPGWTESLAVRRTRENWEARLDELRRFLADGDGCYPDPKAADPAEADLGKWLDWQRQCRSRSDLSAARAATLESLPKWRWLARDVEFDWRICELRHELAGAPIPADHRLYNWVLIQRRRHREGRLTAEQVSDLEALGLLGRAVYRSAASVRTV